LLYNCTVSSPDILDDLIKYQGQLTSKPTEKEMNQAIEEIISKASVKQSQHTVTAYKTDEGFSFEFNSEFINAMYGYSYDYCKSQINERSYKIIARGDFRFEKFNKENDMHSLCFYYMYSFISKIRIC
jgi:hypothetical protein